MTKRLTGLRVSKVSLVKRAAVRDSDSPDQAMTFLVTKEDTPHNSAIGDNAAVAPAATEPEVLKFEGCDECPPVEAWEQELAAKAEGTIGGTPISDLPDSSFAWIEAGGTKKDGKTDNAHRHYPIKDASGKLDRAHVANARARCAQSGTSCPPQVARTLASAASSMNMGKSEEPTTTTQEEPKVPDELSPTEAIARLDAVIDRGELQPAAAQAVKAAFRALVAYKGEVPDGLLHAAAAATGLSIKDTVSKEDLPPVFREVVEQAELKVRKAQEDREEQERLRKEETDKRVTVEFIAKAATLPRVPELGADPVLFGQILKSAAETMTTEHYDALLRVLKATDALISLSDVLKSVGSDRGGRASAMDEIEAKTEALQKADPKLSHAQAMNKVLAQNPQLYAAYKEQDRI